MWILIHGSKAEANFCAAKGMCNSLCHCPFCTEGFWILYFSMDSITNKKFSAETNIWTVDRHLCHCHSGLPQIDIRKSQWAFSHVLSAFTHYACYVLVLGHCSTDFWAHGCAIWELFQPSWAEISIEQPASLSGDFLEQAEVMITFCHSKTRHIGCLQIRQCYHTSLKARQCYRTSLTLWIKRIWASYALQKERGLMLRC